MQNKKSITIDEKTFEIREIRVEQILEVWEKIGKQEFKEIVKNMLEMLTNVSLTDVKKMTGTDILEIIKAVKEANKNFFVIAECLGVEDLVKEIIRSIKEKARGEIYKIISEPAILAKAA